MSASEVSAPEGGSRAGAGGAPLPLPAASPASPASSASAAAGALPTNALSAVTAQLVAPASWPASQPPSSPDPAAAPGAADVPVAGLAALSTSVHTPGLGKDTTTRGEGEPARGQESPPSSATGQAPPATTSLDVGGGSGGGVASATTDAGPAEVLDDDGVPLSTEAAASPFLPPATQRHAAFLKLADHRLKAGLQARNKRCADFSALAAVAGAPLFGDESIIVAYLRVGEARELANQAGAESERGLVGAAEAEVLTRRAWVVLLAQALPVIQARHVTEKPLLSAASLRRNAEAFGYDTAMHAAWTALNLLPAHSWRPEQRARAQAYLLATLRLIPAIAAASPVAGETTLVDAIERHLTPTRYGADFCASVLAVWRSRAVAGGLRSRGALQGGVAAFFASDAEFVARKKADLAKRGLWRCALPSCGKQEATVLQFRVCGHCQRTRYCCEEHAKLHWRAHKREYEDEEEGGEASGEGGGGATS